MEIGWHQRIKNQFSILVEKVGSVSLTQWVIQSRQNGALHEQVRTRDLFDSLSAHIWIRITLCGGNE